MKNSLLGRSTLVTVLSLLVSGMAHATDFPRCEREVLNGLDWSKFPAEARTAMLDCDARMKAKLMQVLEQVLREDYEVGAFSPFAPRVCSSVLGMTLSHGYDQFNFNEKQEIDLVSASGLTETDMVSQVMWELSESRERIQVGEVVDALGNVIVSGRPGTRITRRVDVRNSFTLRNRASGRVIIDHASLLGNILRRIGTPRAIPDDRLVRECQVKFPAVEVADQT